MTWRRATRNKLFSLAHVVWIHTQLSEPLSPDLPSTKTFDEIAEAAGKHFNPKSSSIVQRFRFNSRTWKEEAVAEFVAQLRQLSEHCQFGDTLSDMLRDWIVCGINDQHIQQRLLAQSDLTLAKAMELSLQTRMSIPWRRKPRVKPINLCYKCKRRGEEGALLLSETLEEPIKTVTQLVTGGMANT